MRGLLAAIVAAGMASVFAAGPASAAPDAPVLTGRTVRPGKTRLPGPDRYAGTRLTSALTLRRAARSRPSRSGSGWAAGFIDAVFAVALTERERNRETW
jgi:hypothetical protein